MQTRICTTRRVGWSSSTSESSCCWSTRCGLISSHQINTTKMRTSIADRWKRRRKTSLSSWSIKSSGRISGERAKSGDRESDRRCANDYTAEAEGKIENTNFFENEEFRPWPRVICPRSSTRPTISRLMQSWTKTILFSKRGVSGRTSRCWAMILGGRFFKPFKMKVFRLSLYPSSFAFQHVLPSFDINDLTTNDDTIRRIFFDFFSENWE